VSHATAIKTYCTYGTPFVPPPCVKPYRMGFTQRPRDDGRTAEKKSNILCDKTLFLSSSFRCDMCGYH